MVHEGYEITLPAEEIHSAMGEIIKMAVIKNSTLFGILEEHASSLLNTHFTHFSASEVIWQSIDDMLAELEPNLWEKNLKRCVDFGHSFSPLLEMNSIADDSVPSLTHGQAVGLDVLFSCCLATHRGLMSIVDLARVVNVCTACKLPVTHPYYSNKLMLWESLLDTVRHRNGNQNLPIPHNIGTYVFLQDVTLEDIESTIEIYEAATSE